MKASIVVASLALVNPSALGFAPLSSAPRSRGAFSARQELAQERQSPPTTARFAQQDPAVLDKQETQDALDVDEKVAASVATTAVVSLTTGESAPAASQDDDELCVVQEEEMTETQKLMKQVKDAGLAGVISYALWELGFWLLSVPVVIFGYEAAVGHFPDLSDKDDLAKLGAEAFAFVNFARFAVPLRIGLALSTTPWIQSNVVDKYLQKNEVVCVEPPETADGADGSEGVNGDVAATDASPSEKRVPRWRNFLRFRRRAD